jgi:hypothetical protein
MITSPNEPTRLTEAEASVNVDLAETTPSPGEFANEPGSVVGHSELSQAVAPTTAEQPSWLRRNLFKVSAGVFLGGTAVTLAINPIGGLEKDVLEAAPWTALGIGASESMWVGGAALMAGSAGKKIGNPFKLRSRWGEISQSVIDSKAFKTGLAINTIGALGTAAIVETGAITSLPPETWPGASGIAAADVASTVAVRSGMYSSIRNAEKVAKPKVSVRVATSADIDRLADIDLLLFDKAYGDTKPEKKEVVEMLTQRLANNPGWMFVSEVNGVVEGCVTAFRTNVPIEDFTSWENSTANGTLEGKVDPKGKYAYVANMTIKHEAVELGAEDMLLAYTFANGIRDGVEYGYFVSRMPYFKRWLDSQQDGHTDGNIQGLAEQYLELRREEDGKRYDPQLRMYENYGFKLGRMVPDAFEDDASLGFGVVFKAAVPPNETLKRIKPLRSIIAYTLRQAAKHPKLLAKVI